METHVLFLGAGASIPLGYPATAKLAQTFESGIDKKFKSTFDTAKTSIVSNDFYFDIESLLEHFQGFSNPFYYIKRKGVFASSLANTQPISSLKPVSQCEDLKISLEDHLITNCYNENPITKMKITSYYNRLLSRISKKSDWRDSEPNWHNDNFEIFTTNYDNSLDTYSRNSGQSFTRGIIVDHKNNVRFIPEQFDKNDYSIKIIKIHGSVELTKLENNVVVRDEPPSPLSSSFSGLKIISKVMVYGIEKILTSDPYLPLLMKLKKSLMNASECTVIGYSFRDDWITSIFEEAVENRSPEDFSIYLIDPNATSIAASFPKLKPFIKPEDATGQTYLEIPND